MADAKPSLPKVRHDLKTLQAAATDRTTKEELGRALAALARVERKHGSR